MEVLSHTPVASFSPSLARLLYFRRALKCNLGRSMGNLRSQNFTKSWLKAPFHETVSPPKCLPCDEASLYKPPPNIEKPLTAPVRIPFESTTCPFLQRTLLEVLAPGSTTSHSAACPYLAILQATRLAWPRWSACWALPGVNFSRQPLLPISAIPSANQNYRRCRINSSNKMALGM